MSATDSSGIGVVVSWDGATWAQMSAAPCSCTMSFIQYNGEVLLGNSSANLILKWNRTNWIPFTAILPDAGVNCFLQDGTDLYVGGNFNTVGGSPIRNIAKWDGLSWSAVGTFPYNASFGFNKINALEFYMGDLYACGLF